MKKVLKNKVFNYVFSRYAIYGLQFVNTLVLAKLLSPFNFGIWSFTQLVIMYFAHIDFGIPSSFNALASINVKKTKFVTFNFNAALTLTAIICGLVIIFFGVNNIIGLNIGVKYKFDTYLIYVLLIIVLSYFNKLFMNLFRVYNRLKEITFYQSIAQVTMLGTYILFKEDLIHYLLLGMILSNVLSLIVFLYNCPLSIKFNFSRRLLIQIQKSSIFFFIYNASFYFIMLSTRSIVGYFYSVEKFGLFNFAFSMANIIELILTAFVFLIFPKMINRLANSDNQKALKSIDFMQSNYTVLVSLMSYSAIALFPVFIMVFPSYQDSVIAFILILLTKLIYANCFGAPVLLMARKKEKKLAAASFLVLIINITTSILIVHFFQVKYPFVILGTVIAYTAYVLIVNHMSLKELKNFEGFSNLISYSFPFKQTIPLFMGLFLTMFNIPIAFYPLLLVSFAFLNYNSILELKRSFFRIAGNPQLVDI